MKRIIFIGWLIIMSLYSYGQSVIDTAQDYDFYQLGQHYKYHILKQGESLYALSKVYNIPLDQLISHNLFKNNYVKPGDGVKVPVVDDNFVPKPLEDTIVCCLHKVKRNESLYSIADAYGVSQQLIIQFNPSIQKKGLRRRRYIRIPEIKSRQDVQDPFFIYHIIRKGETPQLVSLYFNIPTADLMEFNSQQDFSFGHVVAVPKKHYNPTQTSILRADYLELPDLTGLDELQFISPANPPCKNYHYSSDSTFNIALLLPLFINENQAQLSGANGRNFMLFDKTNIFYQYLFGTFIAINELQQLGINIHLHIYDTRRDSTRLKNILQQPEMKNMDLIIGPVYSYNYKIIKPFSYQYHINFISPLSHKHEIIDRNPFVFMVTPSDKMLMKRIAQFIAPSADTVKTLVLTEYYDNEQQQQAQQLTKYLKEMAWQTLALDTVDITTASYDPTQALDTNLLSSSETNYVIIPSKNEVFVDGALNQLNAIKNIYGYKITVIGLPSWENFRNFDLKWYITLNIHYPSAFYVDKESQNVINFRDKYLRIFNELPDYYSYLGYDITTYFVHALRQYGKTFQYCISPTDMEPNPRGIFLNFDFKRADPYSGFENNAVFMIYYDNNLKMHKIENLGSNLE